MDPRWAIAITLPAYYPVISKLGVTAEVTSRHGGGDHRLAAMLPPSQQPLPASADLFFVAATLPLLFAALPLLPRRRS